ncbi:MAG: hypothetical protein JWM34_3697 [Ilumatobacteraceae bacterium]|nr:hypothetical protein [Ilumatobacteraceae bacterium]
MTALIDQSAGVHTVELRTERGELIRRVVDVGHIEEAASASTSGCCLRFIDPYGETVFNYLQAPVLADEIESARDAAPADSRDSLTSVAALARECADNGGTYLWFIGD